MMGLHPTSVNDNPHWREELALVERYLTAPPEGIARFCAVGEIGLDYYWSGEFVAEQVEAFVSQCRLAAGLGLPVAIHTRAAWDDMCRIIGEEATAAAEAGAEAAGRVPRLFGGCRHLPETESLRRFRLRNRRRGDFQEEQAGRYGA